MLLDLGRLFGSLDTEEGREERTGVASPVPAGESGIVVGGD